MITKQQREVEQKRDLVLKAIRRHPKGRKLVAVGHQRDSLLRALVPLYVAARYGLEAEITCGVTHKVWAANGVPVQASVIAKALREHIGYARRTKVGMQITPNGIKYVEAALRS